MPNITAIAGKSGTLTVNGVTAQLSRITVRTTTGVIKFATTGQTADADSNYWMNTLSGINEWSVEGDGYIDNTGIAAGRFIGDSIKFRPGTGASGTVAVLFAANHGFSGSVIVESIEHSLDAEDQSKPDKFRVSLIGNGSMTYTNS